MRTRADDPRYPRRAVLSAGAAAGLGLVAGPGIAVGLGGCGLFDRRPEPPPGPDPLEPVRAQAQALIDRYDAVLAAVPALAARLTPLRDAHRTHLAELTRVIGTPAPSAGPAAAGSAPADPAAAVPTDPAAALTALRTAEEAARVAATTVCLAVPGARAALAGSIVACRASHVEVLR